MVLAGQGGGGWPSFDGGVDRSGQTTTRGKYICNQIKVPNLSIPSSNRMGSGVRGPKIYLLNKIGAK